MITAGISGSTGALDITDSGTTDANGDSGDERNRNDHPGCGELGGADVTTVGGAIDFSGAVTGDISGSATAVGTGAGGGDVTAGSTLTLSSGGNDDLTITAEIRSRLP